VEESAERRLSELPLDYKSIRRWDSKSHRSIRVLNFFNTLMDEHCHMLDVQAFKDNERLAWDLCAERYDRWLTSPFTPFSQKLVSLAQLERGQKVLDVATGSGLAAFLSVRLVGPEGQVIGTDLSDVMIQLARERASAEGLDNVEFVQMDAERLEFPSESFDAVLCALGLMLFPAPGKALSEMYRVLRTDGIVALSVMGRGSRVALRAFIEPFVPHMPPPEQRGPSTFGFGRLEILAEALDRAGFLDVRTEQESYVLAFDDLGDVWELVLSFGRLGQMYSRLAPDGQDELKQQVFQIARDKYVGRRGRVELPFEITYAAADK
jgi:SAM-dependent methyltransferase